MAEKTLEIQNSLLDLDSEKVVANVKKALQEGLPPLEIVKSLAEGMKKVGEKYEAGEFFLPELMMAGETVKEAMNLVAPHLKHPEEVHRMGKVVLGTVEGDLHDIGKSLVGTMLRSSGFDVVDLGADVAVRRFVESVRNERPSIVAMSALLTSTMDKMKDVIDELDREGLRKSVKVLVGGAPIDEGFAKQIGADAYGRDAMDAVRKAKGLAGSGE